jgi:UDP-glucose:(heptosyl)LPS alpha-1,3-glucosyltransferase
MRLAIIRQRYTPYGGAERFVESALEALLERDVAITLYSREWPETRLKLIEPHIVNPFYIGSLWRDYGFARAVSREVGRAKLDLVQSHERLLACDVYRAGDGVHAVWLAERLRDAPWWKRLSVRLNPWHRYVLATERKLFASPLLQAVICNSAMVRDEIKRAFAVPDDKLRLIHNAVDSQAFSPGLRDLRTATRAKLRIADDAIVYLFVGSGFERKGVATAIEALAEQPAPAHLVIVGRDKHLLRYHALAKRLGVADRVTLTGPVADPKPFYGASDVFVLPTVYDPFPNAALEAMASGLPVITSLKSGAAELVVEREAGLVVRSRDVAGLAAQMRTLADAATRERMGTNARNAVLHLTPEAMTLALVLLYKELLEASALRQKHDAERKLRAHRQAWAAKAKVPAAEPAVQAPAPDSPAPPAASLPAADDNKPPS